MSNGEQHLEPRVARLEVSLETLTQNVNQIAITMRDNANATNTKLDALAIAIERASAPRRTDWGVLISAVGLIMALGAAVLIPINNQANSNKQQIESYHQSMVEHMKLPLHPVGQARIDGLEKRYDTQLQDMITRDAALDVKLQRETSLMTEQVRGQVLALDERLQREMRLLQERDIARLDKIENRDKERDLLDQQELRGLRHPTK